MEHAKRNFSIDPSEMTYHKDRFLTSGRCERVNFVGAFRGDSILTTEIEVVSRGVELGKVARFLVRSGSQETHLDMNLETCRYEAESNIKTKQDDVELVFEVVYVPEEVVA